MMRYPIEQGGGHFLVAKNRVPFTESEIGGDDEGRSLIQMGEQMKDELAAVL